MKTYSTKANANRAAKKAGLEAGTFNVLEIDGRFLLEVTKHTTGETDLFDEAQAEAEFEAMKKRQDELKIEAELAASLWLADFVPYNPQLLLPAPKKIKKETKSLPRESVIDNPVKMVWEIADRMWGQRRKDIIAECVRMGIAYNTARTQYQAFYKVKSQEGKN